MLAIKARFDGQNILVPEAIKGSPPAEVIVLFPKHRSQSGSFRDVVGKAPQLRTAEDIDRQITEERMTGMRVDLP